MSNKMPQISESEWQVMKVLWQNPGLTAAQVSDEVSKENDWSSGTTRTYLRRLVAKEALRFERDKNDSRIYYYYPIISETEAIEHESKSLLGRIVKGKAGIVLASLIKDSDLTPEDINELESILNQRRDEEQ
ncbi:BlaI/MecI/CopY family transcriptional regulator [Mahella australiensis]|uniref:Transcriptional repressor, CopY family n=1 Tax=Mahella australiensis (strain DSM 15567 / CIP 107919 / 50-1 BON) TaxID=697281 RepID=F3ZX54_MAHA5|nr:BlaI/MecI/CopY family transcriptional regulator [Mahella australiensis]AEE95503.1 transcriptional repressor, CopY family [Mahella australiensis 50-1 BON]